MATINISAIGTGINRAAVTFSNVGSNVVNFGDKVINVETLPDCPEGLYVKFLDSNNGYYKHWLFNRYYTIEGNAESIGSVINYATQLNQPSMLPIGKRDIVRYILTADGLDEDMMNYLVPVNKSPRVYLQINDVWVLCEVEDGAIPYRKSKKHGGSLTISVRLPGQYNVTML